MLTNDKTGYKINPYGIYRKKWKWKVQYMKCGDNLRASELSVKEMFVK